MNIYISNLNFATTGADLEKLFAPYGTVSSARIVNAHLTGRSKGFGFVEVEEAAGAQKAIEALHGTEFQGKTLNVAQSNTKGISGPANGAVKPPKQGL